MKKQRMKIHNEILQGSLIVVITMLLFAGCSGLKVTELGDNLYEIDDSVPDYLIFLTGNVLTHEILEKHETGIDLENYRKQLINRAEKYCEKSGKFAIIESINATAVPLISKYHYNVSIVFSCGLNYSDIE